MTRASYQPDIPVATTDRQLYSTVETLTQQIMYVLTYCYMEIAKILPGWVPHFHSTVALWYAEVH